MKKVTMREIADQLQIPRTTLIEWKNQFEEYIPTEGEGRTRRYIVPDALDVFSTIAKLKQKDMTADEIAYSLQAKFPITIQEAQQEQPVLFMGMMESFAEDMKKTQELMAQGNALMEKELILREQELHEQQLFRQQVMEKLDKRHDEVNQALLALREAKQETAAAAQKKRKWWHRS